MSGIQPQTILLVDDDLDVRKLFREMLESLSYRVVGEASDGQEALEKYRQLRPDAVILDLYMPIMDGLTALKAIIKEDADANVIMLTAEISRGVYEECMLVGAKRYISKAAPRRHIRERILESIQLPMLGG